jgi:hypothetical protein
MTDNPLNSLTDYSRFVAELLHRPIIERSTCLHASAFRYKEFLYHEEHPQDLETIRTATQQGKTWGVGFFGKAVKIS